jgi:4-hydroxybenzoate polyprenyltransferase
MSIVAILQRDTRTARLWRFVCETHPPAQYLPLAFLWSLSLLAVLQRGAGRVAGLSVEMLVVPVSFFLVLLFLRAIDEIKDLDYDRLHKADRPLVRGDVSVSEVWLLSAVIAFAVQMLNLFVDPALTLFTSINISYGLFLLVLERNSRRFRESILLNLVVTFPVSAALNVFAWLYLSGRGAAPDAGFAVPLIAAYIAGFLHFEFGRKLKWPHLAASGENGYAMVLGSGGALLVCFALGVTACFLATRAHLQYGAGLPAWLPWIALLPSLSAARRFLMEREVHRELKPWFALFLVLFFVSNLIVALTT